MVRDAIMMKSTAGTVRCDRGHLITLPGLSGSLAGGRCASNERIQVAFLRSVDPQCWGMKDDSGTGWKAGLWLQGLKHRTGEWRRKRSRLERLPGVSDSSLGVN